METPINLFDDLGWQDAREYPAGTKKKFYAMNKG